MHGNYCKTEPSSQTAGDSRTQEERILRLLQEAWPGWVSALDLARISLQYSARIHALRHKRGMLISNKIERQPNGAKHGYFRMGPPPTPRSSALRKRENPQPPQPSLFDSSAQKPTTEGRTYLE